MEKLIECILYHRRTPRNTIIEAKNSTIYTDNESLLIDERTTTKSVYSTNISLDKISEFCLCSISWDFLRYI